MIPLLRYHINKTIKYTQYQPYSVSTTSDHYTMSVNALLNIHCVENDSVQLTLEPTHHEITAIPFESEAVFGAESVVEAEAVYCPGDIIPITNPDFVPEGFHENGRNEDGTIKITEINKDIYQDTEHLIRMHKEEGWGSTTGCIYTPASANCPNGRSPLITAVNALMLHKDINLRGRIVCENGKVFDGDTLILVNELMEDPRDPRNLEIPMTFKRAMEFEKDGETSPLQESITVTEESSDYLKQVSKRLVPSGEYILKKNTFKKNVDGITMYALCDEPKCCLMNHMFMYAAAGDSLPPPVNDMVMDYFKKRTMYKKEDPVNGNFDVCYRCISIREGI